MQQHLFASLLAAAVDGTCVQSMQERHKVVISADGLMPSTSASYASDEQAHKYARRATPLKRTLQRLFPSMFAPGLPVTNR